MLLLCNQSTLVLDALLRLTEHLEISNRHLTLDLVPKAFLAPFVCVLCQPHDNLFSKAMSSSNVEMIHSFSGPELKMHWILATTSVMPELRETKKYSPKYAHLSPGSSQSSHFLYSQFLLSTGLLSK